MEGLLAAAALVVAARNLVPVDDVPPVGEVLWAAVLILQVVGMLPDVIAHDGEEAFHQGTILVRGRSDRQLAIVIEDQPDPAGAETLRASIVKGRLELVEGAEGVLNGFREVAARLPAAMLLHDLPEHRVVGVAAAIVADGGA